MSHEAEREAQVIGLLEAWRNAPLPPGAGVRDQAQLQNVQRVLRQVAGERQRGARHKRVLAVVAAAAGMLALVGGGWWLGRRQSGTQVAERSLPSVVAEQPTMFLTDLYGEAHVRDAAGQPLAPPARLGVGATLEAEQGSFAVQFPSGARVRSRSATQVSVREPVGAGRETLFLAQGRIGVEVPKLARPVEFSVQTPDARVVVHGTRFDVEVDPHARAGAQTRVAVTRGLVEVDSDGRAIWLHAGEHWPDDKTLVAGEADGGASDPAPAATPDTTASEPAPAREIRSDHSLALENRLFATAMARRKAGDLKGALRRLERFLEHHPDSVLVQEARVEHFRLLERLGRKSRAAREARSYLGDYPDGYATDEARRLALEKR
jgi:hypothetical protein